MGCDPMWGAFLLFCSVFGLLFLFFSFFLKEENHFMGHVTHLRERWGYGVGYGAWDWDGMGYGASWGYGYGYGCGGIWDVLRDMTRTGTETRTGNDGRQGGANSTGIPHHRQPLSFFLYSPFPLSILLFTYLHGTNRLRPRRRWRR